MDLTALEASWIAGAGDVYPDTLAEQVGVSPAEWRCKVTGVRWADFNTMPPFARKGESLHICTGVHGRRCGTRTSLGV